MVKYKSIVKVIGLYVTKCPTIAQMKDKLSNMSLEEQFEQLRSQDLLNPLEVDDYEYNLNRLLHFVEQRGKVDPSKEETLERIIRDMGVEVREDLFQYNRRLIEGLKTNDVPVFDKESFKQDKQYWLMDDLKEKSSMGDLERRQVESEKDYVENADEDGNIAIGCYFNGGLSNMNHEINHQGYLEALDFEEEEWFYGLSKILKNSGGLIEDTMLYHGGEWDIHLNVGDHGKFKNFRSASFQEMIAKRFTTNRENHNVEMTYKIYAPKGTKGLCANSEKYEYSSFFDEHEFLLNRNTGFTVLSIDYDKMEAEILLDG